MKALKATIGKDSLNQQAAEDYLKAIFLLGQTESPVRTSRIAEARRVKPASVTNMIRRLDKLKLVHYEKYYGVTLTEKGQKIALVVLRHHQLIELYLIEALDFAWDEVHEQAELLEHVISDKMEERLASVLGHPAFDAFGQPIPSCEGEITAVNTQPLTDLPVGAKASVAHITDDTNCELLTHLADLGILPGKTIHLLEKTPFDGHLIIEIDNNPCIVGYKAATAIHVKQ